MTDPAASVLERARHAAIDHARLLLGGDLHAAEELVEDVVASLWERSQSTGEIYGAGYLIRSVTNAVRDRWRQQQQRARKFEQLGRAAASDESIEARINDKIEVARLLSHLDDRQRQLVSMRYLEGLSQVEIAQRLALPQGTVASGTARALSHLRELGA